LGVAVTLSKNTSSVQVYVYEWLWLAQEQMIGWATTNGYLFWHPLIILFCFVSLSFPQTPVGACSKQEGLWTH
jgi:hypothetical protein